MLTSLKEEQKEQECRWKLRPKWAKIRWYDDLIVNEFRSPEELKQIEFEQLRMILGHAAREVPYYRSHFKKMGLNIEEVRSADDLNILPVLSKSELCDHEKDLQAETLPVGHRVVGSQKSSGTTTGRPAQVFMTGWSNIMFSILKQREARWFRFDPMQSTAGLRLNSLLPKRNDGTERPPDYTYKMAQWPSVGKHFQTGSCVATSSELPIEEIAAWIQKYRPAYLLSNPGVLEQLAFYCGGGESLDSLKGLLSISAHLTASMRERIESTLGVPVQQNYGLNEVGIVAARCPAGRYHVHSEHCLVEIVDEKGQPSPSDVPGRLVVTALRNYYMPLIRYDTDDVAVRGSGPCPCGRTLPSFERIEGRYRRYAFLPEGTRQLVNSVADALMEAPPQMARDLRRYQVHQFKDGNFELRLLSASPIEQSLKDWVHYQWDDAIGEKALTLEIVQVEQVASSPGGKFLEFTSEFNPDDKEMAESI